MITEEAFSNLIRGLKPIAEQTHYRDIKEFESEIGPKIDVYVSMFPCSEYKNFTEEDKKQIIFDLRDSVSFELDGCITVAEEKVLDDWLEKENLEFPYTDRYLEYLDKQAKYDIKTFKSDSFKIIQMLGNPKARSEFHRKGLLIGDVQSGKTASYTAILNRAVDVGYNIIILLTGTTDSLRNQTQERIDRELIGRDSESEHGELIGVGKINRCLNRVMSKTTLTNDFSKIVANTTDIPIGEDRTFLFVTKKNVTTLRTINDYLFKSNENNMLDDNKIDASLFILDDESDNASINTNKQGNEPTSINKAIRSLLKGFTKTAYLAVTATPFANIFIDENQNKEEYSNDLFPSDFISLLNRPFTYLGANKLFGEVSIDKGLGFINDDETTFSSLCLEEINDATNASFKFKHKSDATVEDFDHFPDSLKESLRYFVIVQKLLDFIPVLFLKHRTMMINVSRFVKIQKKLFDSINEWLTNRVVSQVRKYGMYPEKADNPYTGELFELKKIWDSRELNKLSNMTWEEFSPLLAKSIGRIRVGLENNSLKKDDRERLHYKNYPNGDVVIVVGGQCLSRGLTLEGLVVSYFYRNSATYDTLLQMGRWFGYRNHYLKYFKVWIASQSIEWYRYISDASENLRGQIEIMNRKKMTPSQYGLLVKWHPAKNLIITAKNKMRNVKASDKKVPIDIRGHLIESARLDPDVKINECNTKLVEEFIQSLNSVPIFSEDVGNTIKGVFWKGVSKDKIADFVESFQSSKLNLGYRVEELSKYIKNNASDLWTVAIPQYPIAESHDVFINGKKLKTICRPYDIYGEGGKDFLRIYGRHFSIGSSSVTKLGLTDEEIKTIEKGRRENKNTASFYLATKREDLLLLYPMTLFETYIEEQHNKNKKKDYYRNDAHKYDSGKTIWGIGLGFSGNEPAKNEAECFNYYLNPVAIRYAWDMEDEQNNDDI